jgi:hypothetical protein
MALPFLRTSVPARRRSSGEDALAFTGGLILGGLVGAVAAIALAPTDGATLRQRIAERVGDLLGDGLPIPGATPYAPAEGAVAGQEAAEGRSDVAVTSADGRPDVAPAALS